MHRKTATGSGLFIGLAVGIATGAILKDPSLGFLIGALTGGGTFFALAAICRTLEDLHLE